MIQRLALEFISDIVLDYVHEACNDSDETALIGDVAKSREEALGSQGGCEESVLVDTAAVSVRTTAEQM